MFCEFQAIVKSRMLGFCDPSLHVGLAAGGVEPIDSPRLFVRYAFAGRIFEITVADKEELVLVIFLWPTVGERYRHTFSKARIEAHRQALRALRAGAKPEEVVLPMGNGCGGNSPVQWKE